jgi:hypothetical protein
MPGVANAYKSVCFFFGYAQLMHVHCSEYHTVEVYVLPFPHCAASINFGLAIANST